MTAALPNNLSTRPDDGRQSNGFATCYGQIKARVAAIQAAKGMSQQQVMNFASALNGWVRRLKRSDDSVVSKEMTSGFDVEFRRHQDHLIETLAQRTARDQSEHMRTWRQHFEECRQVDMLPPLNSIPVRVAADSRKPTPSDCITTLQLLRLVTRARSAALVL